MTKLNKNVILQLSLVKAENIMRHSVCKTSWICSPNYLINVSQKIRRCRSASYNHLRCFTRVVRIDDLRYGRCMEVTLSSPRCLFPWVLSSHQSASQISWDE